MMHINENAWPVHPFSVQHYYAWSGVQKVESIPGAIRQEAGSQAGQATCAVHSHWGVVHVIGMLGETASEKTNFSWTWKSLCAVLFCPFTSLWPFLPALSPNLSLLYPAILTLFLLSAQGSESAKHLENISNCNRCYVNKRIELN